MDIIERNTPIAQLLLCNGDFALQEEGQSPWLSSWFENSAFIKINIEEFDKNTIFFTYGDSHPTFSLRVNDGKEYRKKLYTYDEILEIIEKYMHSSM